MSVGATHEIALREPGEPKRRPPLTWTNSLLFFFFFNLFCIGVELINKAVTVSSD